jgi:hypothetical protein
VLYSVCLYNIIAAADMPTSTNVCTLQSVAFFHP